MAVDNPRGAWPIRRLDGSVNFRSKLYHRTASGAAAADQLFPGDIVKLTATGEPTLVSAGDTVHPVLGVVKGVLDANQRPRTHSLPTGNAFLSASTEGWVDIYDDPDIVYGIQIDASVLETDIGSNVDVTAGNPSTARNTSGFQAQTIGTGATAIFRIVGLSAFEIDGEPPGSLFGGDNRDLEVLIINHAFRTNAGV
ncbi:MAG: hypothetical protein J3T61_00225 [Candidatus Brocadiales bacterium]|nr:hypothetical protein [Candidatus Bathyanammoxibius sp.]